MLGQGDQMRSKLNGTHQFLLHVDNVNLFEIKQIPEGTHINRI
jgi:hypothetical protein